MLKKFYFWIVLSFLLAISSIVFIHWKTLEGMHEKTAKVLPLYQRLKTLDSLSQSLEKYRRMSSSFRNLSTAEIAEVKDSLTKKFDDGISKLDQLEPTSEDRPLQYQLKNQLKVLFEAIVDVEPMLFSRDAYIKPKVQSLHEDLLITLSTLVKNNDTHINSLRLGAATPLESRSLALLVVVGILIFLLVFSLIVRSYVVYQKPIKNLHYYALHLGERAPNLSGPYYDIYQVLSKLAAEVEVLVKNRHRFILDVVADLQGPLEMLKTGKLLTAQNDKADFEVSFQNMEKVRRGLALFSGSLEDLNDIVEINQLSTRLVETTIDLSELLLDVSRTLFGSEFSKRINISVPPMPVWVTLDVRRFERALLNVISKIVNTIPDDGAVTISVKQHPKGSFRGVEIVVHEAQRTSNGLPLQSSPEQDILKHWISDVGLSMTLVHKIVKVHGGSIMATGVVGSSVSIIIRIPHERMSSNGLISPPSKDSPGKDSPSKDSDEKLDPGVAGSLVFKDPRKIDPRKVEKDQTSAG